DEGCPFTLCLHFIYTPISSGSYFIIGLVAGH
ncbi:MAG: hypothetical protein ACI9LU_002232, partial [Polaribacter sp.]